jgi:hypothetical protein
MQVARLVILRLHSLNQIGMVGSVPKRARSSRTCAVQIAITRLIAPRTISQIVGIRSCFHVYIFRRQVRPISFMHLGIGGLKVPGECLRVKQGCLEPVPR